MAETYLSHNNIYCNLGFESQTVVDAIINGRSGLEQYDAPLLLPDPFCAALISSEEVRDRFGQLADPSKFTKLEQMLILSLKKVIDASSLELDKRVGLLISTTKGNIDILEKESAFSEDRAYLSELGKTIQHFFGFENEAIVLSNACVSGILAVSVAKRFIVEGKYDHVFITSGDLVTKFILSGFNSFQALSVEPCRPYDKNRSGINLGEAAASVLVTSKKHSLPHEALEILGDATRNDANHISGPSRTGEGLFRSVQAALKESSLEPEHLDLISAHGTATPYNDEMEAIAFSRLGMQSVPVHSLKGYFGHTLGAAGLLETIVAMYSLQRNTLFSSKGFCDLGVTKNINIITENIPAPLQFLLKTASGFGGCNTAVIFKKTTI